MKDRFVQYRSSLRSYLRKRGAVIDVRNRTIRIDCDSMTSKEEKRLNELLKWGYRVIENEKEVVADEGYQRDGEESFVAFADEVMSFYR